MASIPDARDRDNIWRDWGKLAHVLGFTSVQELEA